MSQILLNNRTDEPSNPASGKISFYVQNGRPFIKLDDGTVVPFDPVFGQNKQTQKKVGLETNGGTFTTYDTFSVTGLPEGKYRLGVGFVWGHSSAAGDIEAEIVQDGAITVFELIQEPKDPGADQRHNFYQADELDLNGNHTFIIQYRSTNGNTARILESYFELWRTE